MSRVLVRFEMEGLMEAIQRIYISKGLQRIIIRTTINYQRENRSTPCLCRLIEFSIIPLALTHLFSSAVDQPLIVARGYGRESVDGCNGSLLNSAMLSHMVIHLNVTIACIAR